MAENDGNDRGTVSARRIAAAALFAVPRMSDVPRKFDGRLTVVGCRISGAFSLGFDEAPGSL